MKVLFDFSRRGIPQYLPALNKIRDTILSNGHVLTNDLLEDTKRLGSILPQEIYTKLKSAISQSDCLIIEGSTVSISLGYILTECINAGKPVLFLSDEKLTHHKSRFLTSIKSKLLRVETYHDIDQLGHIVEDFFETCPNIKTRFNLVLSNTLDSYVIERSKAENISKTEYIVNLIEADREKREE